MERQSRENIAEGRGNRETKEGNHELVLSIVKSGSCSKHLEQLYETSCEVGCPSLLASSCLEDEFQAAKRNEQLACIGNEIYLFRFVKENCAKHFRGRYLEVA